MDPLYRVGPDKPLSYLPILTIYTNGENPDQVARLSLERGLSTFWVDAELSPRSDIGSLGYLYVYDELALAHLLDQYKHTLELHEWAIAPRGFVEQVATAKVQSSEQIDLFKLIAYAFSDPRPEHARPDRVGVLAAPFALASRLILKG
jgi:hypothetical protein